MSNTAETKTKTFKNARREVLARLKEIKDGVAYLVNGFTTASTVYECYGQVITDEYGTRTIQNAKPRPRRYEEYPENNPGNWSALYAEADRLVAQASMLREFAREQYHATVARNAQR